MAIGEMRITIEPSAELRAAIDQFNTRVDDLQPALDAMRRSADAIDELRKALAAARPAIGIMSEVAGVYTNDEARESLFSFFGAHKVTPAEVQALRTALDAGELNGEDPKLCIIGRIARARGLSYDQTAVGDRRFEQWLIDRRIVDGATPQNHASAVVLDQWLREWLDTASPAAVDERVASWSSTTLCQCPICRSMRGEPQSLQATLDQARRHGVSSLADMMRRESIAELRARLRRPVDLVDPTVERPQGWTVPAEPRDVATLPALAQLLEWIEPTRRAMVVELLGKAAERASAWCERTLDDAELAKRDAELDQAPAEGAPPEQEEGRVYRLYRAAGVTFHPLIGPCPCSDCAPKRRAAEEAATGCPCAQCVALRARAAGLPIEPLPPVEQVELDKLPPAVQEALKAAGAQFGAKFVAFRSRVNPSLN